MRAPGTVRAYEATLRAIVPKVAAKLLAQVLPMSSVDVFYSFLNAVVLIGPEAASSASTRPGVRWSSVKLVQAAVA